MSETMSMIRPSAIAQFSDNGVTRLLPISEREVNRTIAFFRRVLASDWNLRGRFALILGTQADAYFLAAFERALQPGCSWPR